MLGSAIGDVSAVRLRPPFLRRETAAPLQILGALAENSADGCSQGGCPELERYERVEVCLEEVRGEENDPVNVRLSSRTFSSRNHSAHSSYSLRR